MRGQAAYGGLAGETVFGSLVANKLSFVVLPWFYQLNVFKFQTDFGHLVFPSLMNIEHDEDKNSREKYFVEKEIKC